jgi:cysteine-rich repeat protein
VGRRALAPLALLAAALVAGCYSPHYPVGLKCAPMTRACPPGQGCNVDGYCAPNPDGSTTDAASDAMNDAGNDAGDLASDRGGDAADATDATDAIDAIGVDAGPRCGDGTRDPGEECDDRNDTAGDGCDPTCHIEGLIGHWGLGDEFMAGAIVPDLATADGTQNGVIVNHISSGQAILPVADRHGAANQAIQILYDSPKDLTDAYGYIHFPTVTSLPASVTMTVWIAQGSGDGEGLVLGMNRGPQLYQKDYAIHTQVPSSAGNVTAVGSVPLTSNRWTFVAGVFTAPATTGATWSVSLYVDGALSASGTPANAGVAAVDDLLLGGVFNCNGASNSIICDKGFVGSLDDARLYARALSASEIQALFLLP